MRKRIRRPASPRAGRPPLQHEERRTRRLPLHLSEAELSLLERRADGLGLPAHRLARSLAVQGSVAVPPVPKVNYSAVGLLGRTANLLRQALRQVRAGRLSTDLQPLLEDCLRIVTDLRHALVEPQG